MFLVASKLGSRKVALHGRYGGRRWVEKEEERASRMVFGEREREVRDEFLFQMKFGKIF